MIWPTAVTEQPQGFGRAPRDHAIVQRCGPQCPCAISNGEIQESDLFPVTTTSPTRPPTKQPARRAPHHHLPLLSALRRVHDAALVASPERSRRELCDTDRQSVEVLTLSADDQVAELVP